MNRERHIEAALAINAATRAIVVPSLVPATPPRQLAPEDLGRPGTVLSVDKIEHHLLFMADEVARLVTVEDVAVLSDDEMMDRLTKAHRWIGFIQGALWAIGITSIDSLRDATRGAILDAGRARAER